MRSESGQDWTRSIGLGPNGEQHWGDFDVCRRSLASAKHTVNHHILIVSDASDVSAAPAQVPELVLEAPEKVQSAEPARRLDAEESLDALEAAPCESLKLDREHADIVVLPSAACAS